MRQKLILSRMFKELENFNSSGINTNTLNGLLSKAKDKNELIRVEILYKELAKEKANQRRFMNNYFHQSSKCKVLNKTLIKVLFREVENKTKDNVLLDTINENFIFDMSYLELEEIRFTQAQLRRKSKQI